MFTRFYIYLVAILDFAQPIRWLGKCRYRWRCLLPGGAGVGIEDGESGNFQYGSRGAVHQRRVHEELRRVFAHYALSAYSSTALTARSDTTCIAAIYLKLNFCLKNGEHPAYQLCQVERRRGCSTDRYRQIHKDGERREVSCGRRDELPKAETVEVVRNVPRSQETEDAVSI